MTDLNSTRFTAAERIKLERAEAIAEIWSPRSQLKSIAFALSMALLLVLAWMYL